VCTTGIVRARCKIGMTNLASNMRPFRLSRKDGESDRVNRRVMRFGRVSASIKPPPEKPVATQTASMRGPGLNDLLRRDLERQSSHQTRTFFEA
jgi:hypothetical protein